MPKGCCLRYYTGMKLKGTMVFLSLLFSGMLVCLPDGAYACTVCHSKNPKMVLMHEALEFKDCFVCHGPNSKRSGERKNEKSNAELCVRCHAANSGGSTLPVPKP